MHASECLFGLKIFAGSLHSKALHGFEIISFLAIPGNRCCHGNMFSVSWMYKYFCGLFACQALCKPVYCTKFY